MNRALLTAGVVVALLATGVSPAHAVGTTPLACAQPNGRVSAIVISGTVAYLGGRFTTVKDKGGVARDRGHLAALDTRTCDLLPWTVNANGDVEALAMASGTLFAGGSFTTVQGVARSRLAGITSSGAVTAFNPQVNDTVTALTGFGSDLYAGGDFTSVSGLRRTRLAGWSVATGAITTWAPKPSGKILAMASDSTRIYVGGGFSAMNGLRFARNIAAVTPGGAVDTTFRAGANFPVVDIKTSGGNVYAAGGGAGGVVALWSSTGALRQPLAVVDGNVQAVAVTPTSVFAGGHFANFCKGGKASGQPPKCLEPLQRKKALEVTIGASVTGWAPVLNSSQGVEAAAYDPATGRVWMGGDFTKVNQKPVDHLAVFG